MMMRHCQDCGKVLIEGMKGEDDVASGVYWCPECDAELCYSCMGRHQVEDERDRCESCGHDWEDHDVVVAGPNEEVMCCRYCGCIV